MIDDKKHLSSNIRLAINVLQKKDDRWLIISETLYARRKTAKSILRLHTRIGSFGKNASSIMFLQQQLDAQ
jgi:hypothetical protein